MRTSCNRHPTQAAWWQCPACAKMLCPQCISQRKSGMNGKDTLYFCPTCNREATPLGLGNVIPPFWKNLHRFFIYPLSSLHPILLVFGLAVLTVLLQRTGILFGLLRFGVWGFMLTYSFEALRHTAQGNFKPPQFSIEMLVSDFHLVFRQLGLFFVLWILFVFGAARLGVLPTLLISAFVVFTLPAMIIILAVNEDIGQALNPLLLLGLISRIGGRYLLLFFFLFLLLGAPSALAYALIRHLPSVLQQFFWVAAKNFYLLITYHLLGYVILQYHERVNFPVEYETVIEGMYPDISPAANAQPAESGGGSQAADAESAQLLGKIGALVQEGKIQAAIELVRPNADHIEDPAVSKRYVALLEMAKQSELLQAHLPRHVSLLVKSGEKQKTIEYWTMAQRKGLDLKLGPQELYRIAGWLNEKGQAKAAIQAFSRFAKAHPKDALVPKAYYLVAQIFHERLMEPEKAKGVLQRLIRQFPNHEMAGFAQSYLGRL
jgi:TolA-binding protein